jgi:hypothetical protein
MALFYILRRGDHIDPTTLLPNQSTISIVEKNMEHRREFIAEIRTWHALTIAKQRKIPKPLLCNWEASSRMKLWQLKIRVAPKIVINYQTAACSSSAAQAHSCSFLGDLFETTELEILDVKGPMPYNIPDLDDE